MTRAACKACAAYLSRAGGEHSAVAQGEGVHILQQGICPVVLANVLGAAVIRVNCKPLRCLPAAARHSLNLADVACSIVALAVMQRVTFKCH